MIDLDRVGDVELLRQVAKVQDAEIRRLHTKLSGLARELAVAKGQDAEVIASQLALLEKELQEAHSRTYKHGSERRPRSESEKKEESTSEEKTQRGHGPTPQPSLPIQEERHELDEADKVCTSCGGALEAWTDNFETSEEIDVVDVAYVVKKHMKQKYRCRCGGCVETANGPDKLIAGGRYSLAFAVHVAIQKYCDHLPLERQVQIMARAGLDVTTQTLWDQLFALSRCFTVAIEDLHRHLLEKEVLLADETRWPLLGAKGRKTKNWFDWVLVSEDAVLHTIQDSRSNESADKIIAGFKGVLLTDGYGVYSSRAKEHGYVQAHDWSHARRRFLEAEPTASQIAAPILDDIGKLFLIEREIVEAFTGKSLDDAKDIRLRLRQERSKPIVERIGQRAHEVRALRDSPIAKAVVYLENQWEGLIRFLVDPRIPITSNAAEAALRGLVLGRNNHFGSKSKRGTEVSALFYSLIESAKMNGLDPAKYLRFAASAHLRTERVPLPHEVKENVLLATRVAPRHLALPAIASIQA